MASIKMRSIQRPIGCVVRENPVQTTRVSGAEPETILHESWDIVGEILRKDTSREDAWVLIEVRPIPVPEGAHDFNDDTVGGEITIYFAEAPNPNEHVESDVIDFIRENWTRRVQGEVDDWYPLSSEHPEDLPLGYRRVLADCLEHGAGQDRGVNPPFGGGDYKWSSLQPSTPVVIHVPGDTPLITTLNAARLGTAEAEVYNRIYDQAMGRKEYEETNEDAVSDLPTAGGMHESTTEILRGDLFIEGPNGQGWVTRDFIWAIGGNQKPYDARNKLLQLKEDCEKSSTNPERKIQDLRRFLREAVKYSDIWCLSDPNDARRPDPEKDYVFMVYETVDMIEDQLGDDEMFEQLMNLTPAGLARVTEALDRVDVELQEPVDPPGWMRIGDVNAHWLFSIDVDTLIEEMYGEWQDLDPDSFEDEDEAE